VADPPEYFVVSLIAADDSAALSDIAQRDGIPVTPFPSTKDFRIDLTKYSFCHERVQSRHCEAVDVLGITALQSAHSSFRR
jgi:hypothetical protein